MQSGLLENATESEAKASDIPHQLDSNYIRISFQIIASRDRCDLVEIGLKATIFFSRHIFYTHWRLRYTMTSKQKDVDATIDAFLVDYL